MPEFLIEQRDHFFPETEILLPLVGFIMEATERKIVHNLDNWQDVPIVIQRAAELSRDTMQVPYNLAILKKYTPGVPSAAYDTHKDPHEVSGAPLFLCTLDGTATLDIWDSQG
jgi:hypothetical protein